jgi:predicted  nucleic acid-binding Zn-ribbon protein/peptidoglycan hydrolase-like protein with peptidoglycan-binding domain
MSSLKKYLQSIRQYTLPKTRALQQELEAVREAHAAAAADHAKVQENLQRNLETDAQLLAELRQQVKQTESQHSDARQRVESLTRSLADAGQRQKSTEEHEAALQTELEEERNNAREQVASLERSLADAELRRKATEELKAALQAEIEEERNNARERVASLEHSLADAGQRREATEEREAALKTRLEGEISNALEQVKRLESSLADAEQKRRSTEEQVTSLQVKLEEERSIARERAEHLERSLADAEQRRKATEKQGAALEARLEDERRRHEKNIRDTEAHQAQMQAEQQAQLTKQTELANSFHDVSTRLFESLQEKKRKQRYSLLQLMIIAAALFVIGTLIGILFQQPVQDSNQELALVERNIDDMRGFTKQHIENQDALLKELALNLNKQASAEQMLLGEKLLELEEMTQATDTPRREPVITFTPDIAGLQTNLMALGFDLGITKPNGEPGIKTRQALQEFRQFYLPQSDAQDDLISETLEVMILKSADRTRAYAARFRIGNDVLPAILLGSIRTGVDFSFLMEMARVESYFNPAARAPKSSATGLFQFKSHDWLQSIQTFGASYGLQDYATRTALIDDKNREQQQQPIIYDPLQQEVLALRFNPRLSTLMAAENIKRNFQVLSEMLGREPGRTDLYLAHFLGTANAALFLEALAEDPTAIAADLFPEAAANTPGVFRNRQRQPRTVAEVYQWLDRKLNTARYDEPSPG